MTTEYERGYRDGERSARDEASRLASTQLHGEFRDARDRMQTIVDEQFGMREHLPLDALISEVEATLNDWRNRVAYSEDEARVMRKTLDAFTASHWHPVGDGAHAAPFGTIRVCRSCHCLVAGGPTECGRCVALEEAKSGEL